MENLVGQELEVFTNDDSIKTIKVVKTKEVEGMLIIIGDDGEIYTEEDVNWSYRLTPECILWNAFKNNEANLIFDYELFHKVVEDFMDNMVKSGYVETK